MVPVRVPSLPTKLPPCTENQMSPLLSKINVCGSRASGFGIMCFSMSPVAGSSRPMCMARLPAYHTNPSSSTIRLCGPVPGSSS